MDIFAEGKCHTCPKELMILKKQNAELVLINEDLNSRLALYENPHTTSLCSND